MTDISEILNSEAHDAPSVARRAMEIIRRLEAAVDEAQGVAREYHDDLWSCFNQFPALAWLAEELTANAKRLLWLDDEEKP